MIDPTLEPGRRARRGVIRGAILYGPAFVVITALTIFNLIRGLEGHDGAWILFGLSGLMMVLLGVGALASLRDLFAVPVETQGRMQRKWTKADLFLLRGHYVMVRRRVYRIGADLYLAMPDVDGWLSITHYPHTNAIIHWRALDSAEVEALQPAAPGAEEGRRSRDAEPERLPRPPAREAAPPRLSGSERVSPPSFSEPAPPRERGRGESPDQR